MKEKNEDTCITTACCVFGDVEIVPNINRILIARQVVLEYESEYSEYGYGDIEGLLDWLDQQEEK